MTKLNILITSAGRRVELAQDFKRSLIKHYSNAKIFTCDVCPELSAACMMSDDTFKVPKITDQNYIDSLIDICSKNSIGLVIPTIDTDLEILSKSKKRFEKYGIHVIVSSNELIDNCIDKINTIKLFDLKELKYPKIYQNNNLEFPCFCKPRKGFSSQGSQMIKSPEELSKNIFNDSSKIFMEYINNDYDEYSCDLYFDKNSHLKCAIPRHRISTRAGEVNKSVTRKNYVYDLIIDKFNFLEGAIGCFNIQLFANNKNQDIIFIEINPRFSGGFPLSYAAGGDYINWLIQEYFQKKEIAFFDNWQKNLLMVRYDAKILKKDFE